MKVQHNAKVINAWYVSRIYIKREREIRNMEERETVYAHSTDTHTHTHTQKPDCVRVCAVCAFVCV